MITNHLFGNQHLHQRLGNQLFQFASLTGIAHRCRVTLKLPFGWTAAPYFQLPDGIFLDEVPRPDITIHEPSFGYSLEWLKRREAQMQSEIVNVQGFLQSEKYWLGCKECVRQQLAFRPFVLRHVHRQLARLGVNVPQTVAISVRRGDFVTDPNHYLLGPAYYRVAFQRFFHGWDAFFFSDDLPWCEQQLGSMASRSFYAYGMNAIEQLCLMSLFGHFIIANSTFSWWGAYLSQFPGKKVIRPVRHFDGECLNLDLSDHYPEAWLPLDVG